MGRIDYETETLVTHALRADEFDASEDGTGRGTPLVVVSSTGDGYWKEGDTTGPLRSRAQESHEHLVAERGAFRTSSNVGAWDTGDRTDALTTGTDQTSHILAFSCKDHGGDVNDVAPTLRAVEFDNSHANGGGQIAVAFEQRIGRNGRGGLEDIVPPLKAESGQTGKGDSAPCAIILDDNQWAVRRLTPFETAALQGFPDRYAHIPRKPRKIDAEEAAHYMSHGVECWKDGEQWMTRAAADGPIYRAHGNSMAVNVMSWLGKRLALYSSPPNTP